MKEIQSANGPALLVDEEDYLRVSRYRWHVRPGKRGVLYAYRATRKSGRQQNIYLHREILGLSPTDTVVVDHRDRNGLNNQRSNLRVSTRSQNQANSVKPDSTTATSTFKGVSLHRPTGLWRARIKVNYRGRTLGYFKTARQAAEAYNLAAHEAFGEFARINPL